MTAKGCCSAEDSQTQKQLFAIWAERNGDLSNNAAQWGFGAGNWTRSAQGLVLPFACKLIAMSLSLEGSPVSTSVRVVKNDVNTEKIVKTLNSRHGHIVFDSDLLEFASGDYFSFQTVVGNASSDGGIVTAWFEREV